MADLFRLGLGAIDHQNLLYNLHHNDDERKIKERCLVIPASHDDTTVATKCMGTLDT
jgi:hypothetical protein